VKILKIPIVVCVHAKYKLRWNLTVHNYMVLHTEPSGGSSCVTAMALQSRIAATAYLNCFRSFAGSNDGTAVLATTYT